MRWLGRPANLQNRFHDRVQARITSKVSRETDRKMSRSLWDERQSSPCLGQMTIRVWQILADELDGGHP